MAMAMAMVMAAKNRDMPLAYLMASAAFDLVPDLHPARMRIPALHRLGLTPEMCEAGSR